MAIKRTSSNSISNAVKLSTGFSSAAIPNSPTIGTATATSDVAATVTYTAAVLGATGSTFTATSNPGSVTGTGSSPITVTGLTASTSYTFSVTAGNANGTSAASSASNSITTSAPSGSYESIATATVSGTSTNSISFTSIPSTFKHLQLRITQQTSAYDVWNLIQLNNDTTPTNYWSHRLFGVGSNPPEIQAGNNNYVYYEAVSSHSTTSMAGQIIDILDYANTNKNKVIRHLSGHDNNGSGILWFGSVGWNSTAAINRLDITLFDSTGKTYAANSRFALYGIKGD